MNTIGERIKEIRNSLELTGEEFGAKLNVKKGTVSNWENTNRIPDALMLVRIADLGNVSADYLLCRTDNKNDSSTMEVDYANVTSEELNLLTKLRDKGITINDNDIEILSRIKMIGLKI